MNKPLVAIFARAPRYGAVKTRLARDIGNGETLRFYRNTLSRLVRELKRDGRFDTVLAVTPDTSVLERVWPSGVRIVGQGSGDLGRRMIRALRSAGGCSAIVVGSDIPALSNAHAAAAFRALGRASFVFGAARDGGYWLIGARHPQQLKPDALDGVRWSGRHALEDSRQRLSGASILDVVLDDVDDAEAYRRFQASVRSVSTRRSTSASF
jgi:rSAM/selenodomain-associated transferase 1